MSNNIPAWVGVTYLIYCMTMIIVLMGGAGYAVFVLGHSGWWIAAAALLCGLGYRPGRWAEIITGDTGFHRVDMVEDPNP